MKKVWKVLLTLLIAFCLVGCNSADKKTENADKEVTIYLVRHGKTWFNTTDQVQGYCDSPLTEVGEEQARKVGVGLQDISFAGAYSSDLARQRNTAKLILAENKHEVPLITENIGFREMNYGGFEGGPNMEINIQVAKSLGIEEFPDDVENVWFWLLDMIGEEDYINRTAQVDPLHAAETYDEMVKRGKDAMTDTVEDALKRGGGNILIVSSGGIIPLMVESIVPGQYQGEKIANGSVTIIHYKNGVYTVEVIGDTQYVK
ncbi:hypothetical protein AOC36_08135 [Erysipelothrix larvae]|uniref:Phosphoglycerate mutase n=1 Tax=Erysipelothrix larvae TaxID=1514105 RepID=A0A0X8H0R3_9FIRM|nr:histidine phosphatase family protein [Erysipelothrix larvae]AMC93955.1 hypothetical protein AOC36_08135 [Erysipelothrix larvae]